MKKGKYIITALFLAVIILVGMAYVPTRAQVSGPTLTITPTTVQMLDGNWWGNVFLRGTGFTPNGQVNYVCADGQQSATIQVGSSGQWGSVCSLAGLSPGTYGFYATDLTTNQIAGPVTLTVLAVHTITSSTETTETTTVVTTLIVTSTESQTTTETDTVTTTQTATETSTETTTATATTTITETSTETTTEAFGTILFLPDNGGSVLVSGLGRPTTLKLGVFTYGQEGVFAQNSQFTIVAQPLNSSYTFLSWTTINGVTVDCPTCPAATMTVTGSTGALVATFILVTPANIQLIRGFHHIKR